MGAGTWSHTGFSPSMTSSSKELRLGPHPKHLLQITTRTLKEPDFKFELLPLHSPLLRQSLLVSFPPLIDMLKFSGYSYLIRGQPDKIKVVDRGPRDTVGTCSTRAKTQKAHCTGGPADAVIVFETGPGRDRCGRSWGLGPTPNPRFEGG